jgi:hypothetical protein
MGKIRILSAERGFSHDHVYSSFVVMIALFLLIRIIYMSLSIRSEKPAGRGNTGDRILLSKKW